MLVREILRPPAFIRRRYKTIFGSTIIGLLVTSFCLLWLQNQQVVLQAELRGYDTMFYVRGGLTVPRDIVVVGIDKDSMADVAKVSWPPPRAPVAAAVNFLHRAGARVIGLDFTYFHPSGYGKADDRKLAAAIRRAGNVVLVDEFGTASASNYIAQESSLSVPIPELRKSAAAVGADNVGLDPDNVTRWVPLVQQGPGGSKYASAEVPAFTVAVASVALHKPVSAIIRGLPNEMYVNFVGQQRPQVAGDLSFTIEQFYSVALGEDSYQPYRNKIVLIVPAATAADDTHETPVGQMFGGYIQANTLNTILRRIPISAVSDTTNNLILLIIGLCVAIAASRFGTGWSTIATVAIAVGYLGIAIFLFEHLRAWVHIVSPELTIVLVYASIMAFRFSTEERLKRRIKGSFGLYLKPEIVDLILQSPNPDDELAASRRPISTLFVDIRGFTAMSERMQPEEVVEALDIYLEELTASVQELDGMINKYVGDEIIGVWNWSNIRPQPDHAMLAVRCGLDMVARTDKINEQLRAKGLPAIKYGIGINSGEAVLGQMGSTFRKQYDFIGDTVNTAARLCSAAGGGEIIISQATWEMIGDKLIVEETEPLKLKGKSEPLRTFACVGLAPGDRMTSDVVTAPVPAE